MPSASSTTPSQKTSPTYHVRTMAGDLEASKNGQTPTSTPIAIEPSPSPVFPARPGNSKAATLENIKLSFPKIDLPTPKSPEEKIQPNGNWPPALKPKNPFNNPITKPIMPPQPQPQTNQAGRQAGPPMDLPTGQADLPTQRPAFRPPSSSAPRPLTPPPAPPLRATPPNQIRPPLPPLPKTGPAPLPPLSIPTKPPVLPPKSGSGSKKKLVFMAVLGALILTFVVGEVWWFFLRAEPSLVTTQELLPPPQELRPLLPPEEIIPTMAPAELAENGNLLNYDRVETLRLADLAASSRNVIANNELVKIKITDELTAETIAPTLDIIIDTLKIKITSAVVQNLSEELELFVFGGNTFDQNECARVKNTSPNCWGPRIGLVVKATDPASLAAALRIWEKTISMDLKPLILAKTGTATTPTFQTGTYGGATIRYKNLPINTITVEYAILDDVLIITTSKSAMLKAIDAFGAAEEQILNESE